MIYQVFDPHGYVLGTYSNLRAAQQRVGGSYDLYIREFVLLDA